MASMLNRERIIEQVYRGLAEPADYFFAKANPMFDPSITQQFTYDPQRAEELLAEIGIEPDAQGAMLDSDGVTNRVRDHRSEPKQHRHRYGEHLRRRAQDRRYQR